MRDSEEQDQDSFRLLVETVSCMIVITREDHTIAFFNPYAEQLTGYSAAEVVGKDYFAIFSPECEKAVVDGKCQQLFAGGGGSQRHENTIRCPFAFALVRIRN